MSSDMRMFKGDFRSKWQHYVLAKYLLGMYKVSCWAHPVCLKNQYVKYFKDEEDKMPRPCVSFPHLANSFFLTTKKIISSDRFGVITAFTNDQGPTRLTCSTSQMYAAFCQQPFNFVRTQEVLPTQTNADISPLKLKSPIKTNRILPCGDCYFQPKTDHPQTLQAHRSLRPENFVKP